MQLISYFFLRLMVLIFRFLPFSVLYILADFIKWVLSDVVKYRKDVISNQLKRCFPEKSDEALIHIRDSYYSNLSDLLVESIKGFSMSDAELRKRWKLTGTELTDKFLDRGNPVIINTAHINNFEWGTMAYALQSKYSVKGVYKPLSNKYIENYLRRNRAKTGMELLAMQNVGKEIEELASVPCVFIFVSDQSPSRVEKAHWVDFFGSDTAFIHGVGHYACRWNLPVFYCDIRKLKRGYYEAKLSELISHPENEQEQEITRLYAKKVESVIREVPAEWLWSHKRWKHSRNSSENT